MVIIDMQLKECGENILKLKLSLCEKYKKIKDFLEYRISNEGYRGSHIFQHNRLTNAKIRGIINSFLEMDVKHIVVPKGDEQRSLNKSKGFNLSDYSEYEKFVKLVKEKNRQGTANSIKKNALVDLSRIGIFDKFNNNLEKINPFSRSNTHYFSISEEFNINLYKTEEHFLNEFVSTKIKLIFNDLISCVFDVLVETEALSLDEFLLFVTWKGKNYNNKILDSDDIIDLIKEYRILFLDETQFKLLDKEIKEYANPKAQWQLNVSKKQKRDYKNWKNQSQQIFNVMKSFALFQLNKEKNRIILRIKKDEKGNIIKYKRSSYTKKDYFDRHHVEKKLTFQLDHIIPFSLITNYESYMKIENWQNLIYIDAEKHYEKTKQRNKYMFIEKWGDNGLKMFAIDNDCLYLKNKKDMLVDIKLIESIVSYNKMLKKLNSL